MNALRNIIVQFGVLADEGLNTETGGDASQTLSVRTALAAERKERWACILCKALGVVVQREHCEKQLDGAPMHPLNYIRAGIAIAAAYGMQIVLAYFLWHAR